MNVLSKSKIFLALNLLLFIFATVISANAAPAISTPTPGSTLTSTSVTFTGGHSSADKGHWLYVGTSVGANNLHDSGSMGSGHSRTVSGLPSSGTIHVRWYSLNNGAWAKQDHTYTMSVGGGGGSGSFPPAMSSPSPGSTLTSSSVTFTGGHSSQDLEHWLYVGTSVGAANILNSGSMGTGHSRTVSGLPSSGTIHVRWYSRNSSGWAKQDHTYTMSVGGGGGTGSSTDPYFVSPSGNDANAGTQSAPFRTIKFALGQLATGDTLFVRGGTYTEDLISWAGTKFPSGTSWSTPVKITAFNGETVILKGAIDISSASPAIKYLIFDGINIDATNKEHGIALTGGSHHNRFQNLEVKNSKASGIILTWHNGGSTRNEFLNLTVHHTGRSLRGHGMYVKTTYNLIDGCHFHDNYKAAVHLYDDETKASSFNIVRNNHVHQNGVTFGHVSAISVGGDSNLISNNVVYGNHRGIEVGAAGNGRNTKVLDNTVHDNISTGIGNSGTNTTIKNNIVYGNNPDYHITNTTGLTLVK
jgi:uncharacterized protein YodC (DUF2158 family)